MCEGPLCPYFPNGDVLSAGPVQGMSYVWRSNLKEAAFKIGYIWRDGDSKQIKIWDDPWNPRGTTRSPITLRGGSEISMVADLIGHKRYCQDEDLVRQLFYPKDVDEVLAIPVWADTDDRMAWHFDINGIFSVKSAYRVQLVGETIQNHSGQGASSTEN